MDDGSRISATAVAAMSNYNFNYNQYATTNATSGAYYGLQQQYAPPSIPDRWHTHYPCGHQVKLEPNQPQPTVCEKCGPVKYETYTYKKCGHVYSYQQGQQVPSTCMTCSNIATQERTAKELVEQEREAERVKRDEENKDVRAWLGREVAAVCARAEGVAEVAF